MPGSIASWPAYRFLRRQARWSGIPISWRIFQFVIHTVKDFSIVNEAEVDDFSRILLPVEIGNLISGSSAFSESSLNIWKFMVHVLLKPGLENFGHYFAISIRESKMGGKVSGIINVKMSIVGVEVGRIYLKGKYLLFSVYV